MKFSMAAFIIFYDVNKANRRTEVVSGVQNGDRSESLIGVLSVGPPGGHSALANKQAVRDS